MGTIDRRGIRSAMIAVVLTSTVLSAAPVALADTAPRSATASSDVYKMLADDKGLRVLIVTWKPGQRDQWHSHPVMGVYWLTDCDARVYSPDGKYVDSSRKAGQASVNAAVKSHSFENRSSSTECKAVMVERE